MRDRRIDTIQISTITRKVLNKLHTTTHHPLQSPKSHHHQNMQLFLYDTFEIFLNFYFLIVIIPLGR